jgi:hypothetical protein
MLVRGAWSYRVEVGERGGLEEGRRHGLAGSLFEAWVPAAVRAWLAEDRDLMADWQAWLARDEPAPRGAISELVLRAAAGASTSRLANRSEAIVRASNNSPPAPAEEPGNEKDRVIETTPQGVVRAWPPAGEPGADTPIAGGRAARSPAPERGEGLGSTRTSEVAGSFVQWLRKGIADGSIRVNEPGAMVHGVEEGLLLVSPRVFREFSKRIRETDLRGTPEPSTEPEDATKWVQRQILREGWHLQAERGVNILAYQVMRGNRTVSRLSGVVIRDPAQFLDSVAPVNPVLVREARGQDRA